MSRGPTEEFQALLAGGAFNLDEAALLIAQHAYPDVDRAAELRKLDNLAVRCDASGRDALLGSLFGRLGFHGNHDDYYDPRNSFLNDVVRRCTGIPISLGVLTMEIGRRTGLSFNGIGMPGHFLLQDQDDPTVFVDVFAGGALLDDRQCRELFHRVAGNDTAFHPAFLAPVSFSSILERMLGNLATIYVHRSDLANLEWVLTLRQLYPHADPTEARQLANLLLQRGRFAEAAQRFETLAETASESDAQELRRRATLARSRMN